MVLIAKQPTQHLVDLVGALGGSWHGYVATCRCPAHADHTPSLSIRQGDRGLLVTCFAGCDAADVLRELARIRLDRRHPAPRAEQTPVTPAVERLWDNAKPVQGTLGEQYLASRGLLPAPPDVRFHPRCPRGARPRTVFKPALLVAVRDQQRLVAVQRIFLDPATARYTEKATLGSLGRGAWQAGVGATVAVAEGFETARAWSIIHGVPCWASLGSRRLDLIRIPDVVTTLILAGDNDLPGRRAVTRASERHAAPGRTIIADFPPRHKDWAEHLELEGSGGGEGRLIRLAAEAPGDLGCATFPTLTPTTRRR